MTTTAREVTPSGRRRRRWIRRLLSAVLVLACLYGGRAFLLRGAARLLIVEDLLQPTDYVLLLEDPYYAEVAQFYHTGLIPRILLLEHRPNRLVRTGIFLSSEDFAQRQLAGRGIPEEAITVIPGASRTTWEEARQLRGWIEAHPQCRITLLCGRFESRGHRRILDAVLGLRAGQVRLRALPDRRYDETNWWHHKDGVVGLFDAYVRLGYVYLQGEDHDEGREWDPDEYESRLR